MLHQACAPKRGQSPQILDSKGCEKPSKTIKAKTQLPRHQEKYIEGYQENEQCTYLNFRLSLL